jgi:hypothetical protein
LQAIVLHGSEFPRFPSKAQYKHVRLGKARDIHLSVQTEYTLFEHSGEAEKAAGEEGRPLERFREGAGDQKHVPAKKQSH